MAEHVTRLKDVYAAWHGSRGGSPADWLAMCDENVRQSSPAIYGDHDYRVGKAAIEDYLNRLAAEWEELVVTVDEYIAQDDRVVVLGHVTCRNRATGKVLSTPKVDIYRFENGLAVDCVEYVDSAAVAEARAGA